MFKAHALVIDDNPNNIKVLSQLLMLEDVTCIELSRTDNLSEHLDTFPNVNVVFLDLEFPKTNGYEVLTTIKQHPRFKHVPVIAYTVHTNELETIMNVGFDGFLGKPLSAELFPQQLNKILRGEHVWYAP